MAKISTIDSNKLTRQSDGKSRKRASSKASSKHRNISASGERHKASIHAANCDVPIVFGDNARDTITSAEHNLQASASFLVPAVEIGGLGKQLSMGSGIHPAADMRLSSEFDTEPILIQSNAPSMG